MLKSSFISLATVEELFLYKNGGFKLPNFPGYSEDQWGIKAHNRPWVEFNGRFRKNLKALEVGGGYSSLIHYLATKYKLEAWVGDDFGLAKGQAIWSRWGNPLDLPLKYPNVKYVFEKFGNYSPKYPSCYFDRIYTVSTLEHIPKLDRLDVLKDINRCLSPGGIHLHSIDIQFNSLKGIIRESIFDKIIDILPFLYKINKIKENSSEIRGWIELFRQSGVNISNPVPNAIEIIRRRTLVESPDVVYRFYPPDNAPKPYTPSASLLIIIVDESTES